MAAPKKSTANKNQQQQQASGYVKAEFAIGAAIVCFVLGFFLSRIIGGDGIGGSQPRQNTIPIQQTGAVLSQGGASDTDWIEELEKQAQDNPDSAVAWASLGNAYFDTDRFMEAIDAYAKSIELQPNNPNVLTDMGIMYRRIDQPEEAVRRFESALQIDPTHEMSRFNRGIVLFYDLKEKDKAIDAWKELVKLNPQFRTPTGQLVSELIKTLQ